MNAEEEEEEEEETQRKRRALINGFSSSFEERRDDIAKRVELFRRDTEEELSLIHISEPTRPY